MWHLSNLWYCLILHLKKVSKTANKFDSYQERLNTGRAPREICNAISAKSFVPLGSSIIHISGGHQIIFVVAKELLQETHKCLAGWATEPGNVLWQEARIRSWRKSDWRQILGEAVSALRKCAAAFICRSGTPVTEGHIYQESKGCLNLRHGPTQQSHFPSSQNQVHEVWAMHKVHLLSYLQGKRYIMQL